LLINQDKAAWFCFTRHTSSFEESKGFHVLRCMFSSQGHLYHFVCHSKLQHVKAFFDTDTLEVEFTYAGALSDEIKEQNELCFYINKGPDLSVRVDGKKASLFHLDQTLDLLTQQALLRCSFSVESSHAEIVGHLSYGNRPSSVCDPEEGAFDHKIVLRTLRRSSDCVVRLKLQLIHMD